MFDGSVKILFILVGYTKSLLGYLNYKTIQLYKYARSQFPSEMTTLELILIPSHGDGHVPSMLEFAKHIVQREERLSVTIIMMNLPLITKYNTSNTVMSNPRLRFIDIPCDETMMDLISPNTYTHALVEHHKANVKKIVHEIESGGLVRVVGFVVDMFCVTMIDIANEFKVPSYIYFTSGASMLGLMLYLQGKHDEGEHDVTRLKETNLELVVPTYANMVPVDVLPSVVFDMGGGSEWFLYLYRKFRESKGILVNTFQELESHGIEALSRSIANIPPVSPVGPILNLKNTANNGKSKEIFSWLNEQEEGSVVFLCFGSMGCFEEEQVKEIAVGIEKSGKRFLWSLRRPPPKEKGVWIVPIEYTKEYENPEEVLPEGFLERTSSIGRVVGWVPQIEVLSHPCIGGFVSHCGWNSILESIWCGVPIAAWPVYAEQKLNAFQLVVEMGMAIGITCSGEGKMVISAEDIESGIRGLMSDEEMRKKVKDMRDKSRIAASEGGSSYKNIQRFIDTIMIQE